MSATKKKVNAAYDADNIQNLQFPESVQQKPTLSIGPIDERGIITIAREPMDNVVDEALAGRATSCDLFMKLNDQGKLRGFYILDNGAGIPVKNMEVSDPFNPKKKIKIPAIKAILTLMNTSGKFDNKAYKVARGCFTGDTTLQLLNGKVVDFDWLYNRWQTNQKLIPIQTWDVDKDEYTTSHISHVQRTLLTKKLYAVSIGDDVRVGCKVQKCTPDHPFYIRTENGIKKVRADKLVPGMQLVTSPSSINIPSKVVTFVLPIELEVAVPVYDITVDGTHTFFVEPGVLVSNTHGIGVKASNALSTRYKVWTFREGSWYFIEYEKGHQKTNLTKLKKAPRHPTSGKKLTKGTLVYMEPDAEIFTVMQKRELKTIFAITGIWVRSIMEYMRIAAYFTPGLTLRLHHWSADEPKVFVSKDGPVDFIKRKLATLQKADNTVDLIRKDAKFIFSNQLFDTVVAWTNADDPGIDAFTNGLRNIEGGAHVDAFLSSLKNSIKEYAPKKSKFTVRELKDGMVALINVKLSAPQFDSQTKEKLVDERAGEPVEELLTKALKAFFKEHRKLAVMICERANNLHALKTKFTASKKVISALKGLARKGFPSKCSIAPNCKPADREMYIIEGDSASGSAKGARDERYQETLPLKGKILNAMRDPKGEAIESEEIINVLAQMGYDPKADNPYDKLRVGKIICLADPDPDGPLIGGTLVPVYYEKQWAQIPIQELAEETWLNREYKTLTWNGHAYCAAPARDCHIVRHAGTLVKITLANGVKLECDPAHKWPLVVKSHDPRICGLYTGNLLLVAAKDLKAGDRIVSPEDGGMKHEPHNVVGFQTHGSVLVEKVKTCEVDAVPVYCLTVPEYHNFVVEGGVLSGNCHINSLLLTLFYKFLPELFERGMVYVAEVPEFYALDKNDKLYTAGKPDILQAKLDKAGVKATIQHIKGYGEVSWQHLKILAFDPATRILSRIVPLKNKQGDVEFAKLMGNDSESRKKLLGI